MSSRARPETATRDGGDTPVPRAPIDVRWVRTGIVAGLITCVAYPVATMAPLPSRALPFVGAVLGPSLAAASLGLGRALRLHRPSVAAELGVALNLVAGALLMAMVLVQLAVRMHASAEIGGSIVAVWLGLDVAWDVYVGLGTACFALAMLTHPRFGRTIGVVGLALATLLLLFNLWTFPEPPGDAGLVDLGPAIGSWYLVVTILMWRSMRWVSARAAPAPTDA